MMKRRSVPLAVAVSLTFLLAACRGGKDPYAKLLAHTDSMIKILKDNEGDPDRAARKLNAYQREHEAELQKLKKDLADFMQKEPMKAAPVAAVYGLRSAELANLTAESSSAASRAHR